MYLEIKEEYPPVAIITALSPSSASHCSIKPSMAQAEPLITPDKIASAVLLPIALSTVFASILGSFDVLLFRARNCKFGPGIITPPKKSPFLSNISNVVAVPISTIIAGLEYSIYAPQAFAILSAPASLGFFSFKLIPKFNLFVRTIEFR